MLQLAGVPFRVECESAGPCNRPGRRRGYTHLRSTDCRKTALRTGVEFDIEWARDPSAFPWQQQRLEDFRTWLRANGFDPEEKALTIGHPKVAQVDLHRSFGTDNYHTIWTVLAQYLDVYKIATSTNSATYEYRWSDPDYAEQQIKALYETT
mgnify:CR=1 FL=1